MTFVKEHRKDPDDPLKDDDVQWVSRYAQEHNDGISVILEHHLDSLHVAVGTEQSPRSKGKVKHATEVRRDDMQSLDDTSRNPNIVIDLTAGRHSMELQSAAYNVRMKQRLALRLATGSDSRESPDVHGRSRLAAERVPWAGNELTSSELSLHGDNWRAIGYIISDIAIVTWRQLASHRIYYLGYQSAAYNVRMKQRLALRLATGSDSRESPDVHGRSRLAAERVPWAGNELTSSSFRYMETTGEPSQSAAYNVRMKQRLALRLAAGSDSRESPDVHGRSRLAAERLPWAGNELTSSELSLHGDKLASHRIYYLGYQSAAYNVRMKQRLALRLAAGSDSRESPDVHGRLNGYLWAGNELTSSELSLHGDNWRAIAFERVYLPFECLVLMLRLHLVFREEQSAAYNVRMKRPR
ncbi:hypothetical protein BDZ89DRAFT_1053066 [Hymenopellis radicata]|nr:hypothetical protein BDZ89DRAFT_1053066 [Hymenopellis radicata]